MTLFESVHVFLISIGEFAYRVHVKQIVTAPDFDDAHNLAHVE